MHTRCRDGNLRIGRWLERKSEAHELVCKKNNGNAKHCSKWSVHEKTEKNK
jgi:hypothetical protein